MPTGRRSRSALGRMSVTLAGAVAGLWILGTIGSRFAPIVRVAVGAAVLGAVLGAVAGFVVSGRTVEPAAWKVWATVTASFFLGRSHLPCRLASSSMHSCPPRSWLQVYSFCGGTRRSAREATRPQASERERHVYRVRELDVAGASPYAMGAS